jgi:hypothetical protein
MVAAWIAPCSVKASGRLRRPPQLDVAERDFKFANSSVVSSNRKSSGKRLRLRSWQQAVERYRGLYGTLQSTYGRAAVVGHPWDDTDDQKFIADNWFKLTSMWVIPRGNATVTLNIQPTPPFKPELPRWSIDITVSEAHIKREPKKG